MAAADILDRPSYGGVCDMNTIPSCQEVHAMYGRRSNVRRVCRGLCGNDTTVIQLEEVKRIADRTFALIDSEKNGPSNPLTQNRRDFLEACASAKVDCRVLERRATENYWTERAVQTLKGPSAHALAPFENLKSSPHAWAKSDNWLIARAMKKEEIDQTDLGELMADL